MIGEALMAQINMWSTFASAVATWCAVLVAIGAGWIAYKALGGLTKQIEASNEQLRIGRLTTLVSIEADINVRRDEVEAAALALQAEKKRAPPDDARVQDCLGALSLKVEAYYNLVERVCSLIMLTTGADHDELLRDYESVIRNCATGYSSFIKGRKAK